MTRPPLVKTLLGFAVVYFVWGSTFLAIRIGVREVPPLLFAAMRFTVAGALLYGWTQMRGEQAPSRRQWASIAVVALLRTRRFTLGPQSWRATKA